VTDTATRSEPTAAADPRLGEALKVALDGQYHVTRQKARDTLTKDEIIRDPSLSMDEARAWTLKALKHLSTKGYGNRGFTLPDQASDPAAVVTGFEALGARRPVPGDQGRACSTGCGAARSRASAPTSRSPAGCRTSSRPSTSGASR